MQNLQEIATRIKDLCDRKSVSINKLLDESGAGARTYHNMLSGSCPSIDKFTKIADYLNCSVDYLLGRTSDKLTVSGTSLCAIGYIDFLGAKNDMTSDNSDETLQKYVEIYNLASNVLHRTKVYDIKRSFFSDNMVVAIKCDETISADEAVAYLVMFLSKFQFHALAKELLVRGGICLGDICIDNNFVFGKGLVKAYELESRYAKFPRIILDKSINASTILSILLSTYALNGLCPDLDGFYYLNYAVTLNYLDPQKIPNHVPWTLLEWLNSLFCSCIKKYFTSAKTEKDLQKIKWTYNYGNFVFKTHGVEFKMDSDVFSIIERLNEVDLTRDYDAENRRLIKAYHDTPELQGNVNKILNIDTNPKIHDISEATEQQNNTPHATPAISHLKSVAWGGETQDIQITPKQQDRIDKTILDAEENNDKDIETPYTDPNDII